MIATLAPIFALLRGTGFLLAASGLLSLLLAIRGQAEGFSATSLGLLGTGWAAGFIIGCLFAARLVHSVGHVRAFGAFAASGAIAALLSGLIIDVWVWIALRVLTGFAIAGSFMVIESWLNEKATNESRGTVFGIYMMVTYGAIMAGQLAVGFGDVSGATLFMVCGILYCLALIPTTVSTAASPQPLASVRLDLKALYRNSPVASVACFLIGIANGAWGTLGPVYGVRAGISPAQIAIMMSVTVVAGAILQLPLGRLSDRMDRRYVLATAGFLAALVALVTFVLQPGDALMITVLTGLYGAFAYTLYSLAVAHANDHAKPSDFVKISGGLLLLYGSGTMVGPILGAGFMEYLRPESIFLATFVAHFGLACYALVRIRARAPVPIGKRDGFQAVPAERAATPQAVHLDPRSTDGTTY
jgi:MFS family permease